MGITLDKRLATEKFAQALVLARSETALPQEWLDRTRKIGEARNKTFTPVLGTALLAKATERFVDAFSLRESESHKSYSARSLAKDVLVPCCVRAGVDIRNKGAEPLNNQPFLRAMRISTELKVKPNAVVELTYLCECLTRVDFLENRGALEALAAFLRARIEVSGTSTPIELSAGVLDLPELQRALDQFMSGDNEGGKTGQAIVTAILNLVFEDVRTKKINDPSNRWPGDVGAFIDDNLTISAEVKQRPFTDAEVLLFAQRLQQASIHRGIIAALVQDDDPLDSDQLIFQAHRLYQVDLRIYTSAGALLREAMRYAAQDLPLSLAEFPRYAIQRMQELEVSDPRMRDWAAIFATPGHITD